MRKLVIILFIFLLTVPAKRVAADSGSKCANWVELIKTWRSWDKHHTAKEDADWAKIKKKLDKDEKNFTKTLDKVFSEAFKKIFNDKVKPSDAFTVLKAIDLASAGDFYEATKVFGNFLVSALLPVVASYVKVLEGSAKIINKLKSAYAKKAYDNEAHSYVGKLIKEQADNPKGPYVPSFYFKYSETSPIASELAALKKEMQQRESTMFWDTYHTFDSFDGLQENSLSKLPEEGIWGVLSGSWASHNREAGLGGKRNDHRKLFNAWLIWWCCKKEELGERHQIAYENYLKPLMKKRARRKKMHIDATIKRALAELAEQIEDEEQEFKLKIVIPKFISSGKRTPFSVEVPSSARLSRFLVKTTKDFPVSFNRRKLCGHVRKRVGDDAEETFAFTITGTGKDEKGNNISASAEAVVFVRGRRRERLEREKAERVARRKARELERRKRWAARPDKPRMSFFKALGETFVAVGKAAAIEGEKLRKARKSTYTPEQIDTPPAKSTFRPIKPVKPVRSVAAPKVKKKKEWCVMSSPSGAYGNNETQYGMFVVGGGHYRLSKQKGWRVFQLCPSKQAAHSLLKSLNSR